MIFSLLDGYDRRAQVILPGLRCDYVVRGVRSGGDNRVGGGLVRPCRFRAPSMERATPVMRGMVMVLAV